MKIYVISLLSDIKRRSDLKLRFEKYYDKFSIVDAKDKESALVFKENKNKSFMNGMTLSEIACTLSHVHTLTEISRGEEEFALVLEDDVIGADEDIIKIIEICEFFPSNSILIAGGQDGLKSYKNLYGVLINKKYQIYKIPKIYYRYLARTSSYLISKKIAIDIVSLQEKKIIIADQWDVLLKNCNHVYFSPIFKHPLTLENSHIESERKIARGNNIFKAILREGIIYSLYYYLRKVVTNYWAKYKKYTKIKENL
ncbi:glycosyltransferase family 25 protein [Acinetobacter brisouii]